MTQAQVLKALGITAADVAALMAHTKQPKAAKRTKAEMLADKDRSIRATFTKRGIKDVVLMNRDDRDAPFNVRPYNGWVANGRIVRKGEKSVRGLFHVSQTDEDQGR